MANRTHAASALLLALAIPAAALAEEKKAVTRTVGSVQVTIDPATGKLVVPPGLEREKLALALREMFDPREDSLVVEKRGDGTTLVRLDGRNPTVAVLSLAPDGKPILQCLPDAAAAAAWLNQLSQPQSQPETEPER